jgi:hypothetical protein
MDTRQCEFCIWPRPISSSRPTNGLWIESIADIKAMPPGRQDPSGANPTLNHRDSRFSSRSSIIGQKKARGN